MKLFGQVTVTLVSSDALVGQLIQVTPTEVVLDETQLVQEGKTVAASAEGEIVVIPKTSILFWSGVEVPEGHVI